MKKKVLIVEDDEERHEQWRSELDSKIELLSALSIPQAHELFTQNQDLSAIAMDACVPGDRPNTMPLVQKFRESFAGPMIAISSLPEYRAKLMQVGCDLQSRKDDLSETLLKVLDL